MDVGNAIRPELPHTDPRLGSAQAELVRHVMRHFLDDELSAVLFDALPDDVQLRLAKDMLTASKWMSTAAWQRWVKKGRNSAYVSRAEIISNSSFVAAGCLVAGVLVLACWELVHWIGEGWAWYFGSAHFLGTWPGWLKTLAIIVVTVACVISLNRTEVVGLGVAVVCVIGLGVSIVASPVVRIHAWISSWGTASTIVVGALILAVVIAWLGYLYDDRRQLEIPVQLKGINRPPLYRLPQLSRFEPDHRAGHAEWCVTSKSG